MTRALDDKDMAILRAVGRVTKEFVEQQLEPLLKRIEALEARPQLRYVGTWSSKDSYTPGDLVTHDGSMWFCRMATSTQRPGEGPQWQLCVKKGKDAR